MANTKKKNKGINPVKVGVAGAAIVAAGAAAVALSNKGNRQKAGKVLKNMQAKGNSLRESASNTLDNVIAKEQKVHKKVSSALSKTGKVAKPKTANKTAGSKALKSKSKK